MGRRIDWIKIKQEYVENNITLEELAKKYNVSSSSIMHRSAQESWATERQIFCRKVAEKKQENKIDNLVSESASFDNLCLQIACSAIKIIGKQVSNLQDRIKESQTIGRDTTLLLKNLATALKQFQDVGKVALGENLEVQAPLEVIIKHVRNEPNH